MSISPMSITQYCTPGKKSMRNMFTSPDLSKGKQDQNLVQLISEFDDSDNEEEEMSTRITSFSINSLTASASKNKNFSINYDKHIDVQIEVLAARVADKKAMERRKNDLKFRATKLDEEKTAITIKNKALEALI
jgi:hypothetical protein